MLTPGEFVVNKKATQANLPLLKNINGGYYADGGLVTSWNNFDKIQGGTVQRTVNRYPTIESIDKSSTANSVVSYLPKLVYDTPADLTAISPNPERIPRTAKN